MIRRFRFCVDGELVVGPVQGSGGLVEQGADLESESRARRRLYQPQPGFVVVYPAYNCESNGPAVAVPVASYLGEA